jgi:hypothetical protein
VSGSDTEREEATMTQQQARGGAIGYQGKHRPPRRHTMIPMYVDTIGWITMWIVTVIIVLVK